MDIVAILYDNFNGYYHGQEVHSNVLFYIHSVIIQLIYLDDANYILFAYFDEKSA